MLDVSSNYIGPTGAEHLAGLLKVNQVSPEYSARVSPTMEFFWLDIDQADPRS